MAVPRSESQRERDRNRITELYLQGWTQQQIADELGISRQTVNADVKVLLSQWKKRRDHIQDEFASKYDYIYRESIVAWKRSLDDAEVLVAETVTDSEGKNEKGSKSKTSREKSSLRKEGQSGNPALLAQAQAALKAIREMFGVDAAQKTQHDGELVFRIVHDDSGDGNQNTPTEIS